MEDKTAMRNYLSWLNADIPMTIKSELKGMISKPDEVLARFSGGLSFGTAGLRAPMGTGTARMNVYTVSDAACAVADYLIENELGEKGVVISYDSRHHSREFAEMAASVCAEYGVRVLLSDEMRPVPLLSFAVRRYGAACGIMITASHNPPEYNGIKIYGADGGQITPEIAALIMEHMGSGRNPFGLVNLSSSVRQLVTDGRIEYIGADLDEAYNEYLMGMAATVPQEARENLRIIYTPLNGSGYKPVRRVLASLGYKSVFVPPEQARPDGDFPTMRVPNPEYEDTFDVAIKYAKMNFADVVIATDPDSDRLGVAVPDADGEFQVLTGNQIGILLLEYLLQTRINERGYIDNKYFCVNSTVSTALAETICNRHGIKLYRTLTGSKYAADLIERGGDTGSEKFLFGFEEGNGYMFGFAGTEVMDKDAVAAAMLIAEMAAISKHHGRRLSEQFDSIYGLYGYSCEKSFSLTFDGPDGREKIDSVMNDLRGVKENSLEPSAGIQDADARYDTETDDTEQDDLINEQNSAGWGASADVQSFSYDAIESILPDGVTVTKVTDYWPESDVLFYQLEQEKIDEDGTLRETIDCCDWLAIRPSGTEPKLKVYAGCGNAGDSDRAKADSRCEQVIASVRNYLKG